MDQQGTFTKCENCLHKPATSKLYKKDSPFSLKVCFNCEKQLTSTEQYRHWLSQHLSYSSLKQPHVAASQDVSKSFGVSSIDSVLKSPTFLSSRNYIPTSTQLESTYRNTGARLQRQSHNQVETPKTHQTFLSSHETHPSTTSRQKPLTTSYLVDFHPDRIMTENNASVIDMDDHRPRIMDHKSPATKDFRKEFVKRTNIQVEDNLHHRDIPDYKPLTTQHYVPKDHFGITQTPKNPLSVHTKDLRPTAHFNDTKQRDSRNPLSSRLSHHNKRESHREQQPEKVHYEQRATLRETEKMLRKEKERQTENQDYVDYVHDSQRRSFKRAQRADIYIQRESERYYEEKEAQLRRERAELELVVAERETVAREEREKEAQLRRERAELELVAAEREKIAREEREEQIKFERNCREIQRHYEEIIENIEFQIKEAERKNDKEIDDLRNEIYQVKDELHRQRNIKESKINAETNKIYNKIQALEEEMHQELEGKRYLEDIFRQTKADYEQELNKMKIKMEKIQADAVTEVEEIERNMKKQEEATSIAMRDMKEDIDSHRLKSTKEHNTQLHELQTELDKIDTNIGKTAREGANEVNQAELKLQRAEEKLKQDEIKMENMRQALEEKSERIKRMKQNIEDSEREAVIANNEIELLNQERTRLRIENKRLVGQYAKLNKIYLGK